MYGLIFIAIILILLAISGYRQALQEKKGIVIERVSDLSNSAGQKIKDILPKKKTESDNDVIEESQEMKDGSSIE